MDAISGAARAMCSGRSTRWKQRLLRIEAPWGLLARAAAGHGEPVHEAVPPPLPSASAAAASAAASAWLRRCRGRTALENTFGLGWLNRVAVVTLIFGVGFLFKYAVDSQWIGPAMRVALGIAAATLSLFLGEWISLRGQRFCPRDDRIGLGAALFIVLCGLRVLSFTPAERRISLDVPDDCRGR